MPAADVVHFDDYRLDMPNAQLWRGQQLVKLAPKALSVLDYLVTRPGQLVTKDELFAAVWPEVVVSEGAMAECIREVRRALGETARAPRYVETVHRRGYRFIGQVTDSALSSGSSVSLRPTPPARLVVGREAELAQLQGWYARARDGRRQMVFVAGEAGIGKTTLVEACVEQLQADGSCWVGQGQCIEQYGAGEAYMPVLEALGRLCRGADGQRFVEMLGQHAPTWLVQMPTLLQAEELEALQCKTAGATQQRMLREMAEALEALTAEKPLILVLEDLHWSDYSTVELLATLARRREAARLLVLGTYRIVEVNIGEHHLKRVKQELQLHGQCEELTLDFLSEAAVGDYLARRFGQDAQNALDTLPASLPGFIHRHTDGNPLFVVRVTEDLVQREILTEHDGQWELSGELSEESVQVPEGLRQFIEQQFAQLSHAERSLVEAASVAGVEFSAAAVAAGVEQAVEEVEVECAGLAQRQHFLVDKGVAEWPDGTVAARYGFIHALYQEVFYARLTPGRRSGLHLRIGARAEAAYGARADEIATELALHFERGRDFPRAIQYWQKAGQRALQRSAHVEAINHISKGLELIKSLPNSPERLEQELSFLLSLGASLIATKGYSSRAVEQTYTHALTLCQQLGEAPGLSLALSGLWQFYINRTEYDRLREVAEQLFTLGQTNKNPTFLLSAHSALCQALYQTGEFIESQAHAEQVIALYNPRDHEALAFLCGGEDPGVACRSVRAWNFSILGYPDRALTEMDAALTLAREIATPFDLAFALTFLVRVHQTRGESQCALERAEEATALSIEQGFLWWEALVSVWYGWVLRVQGQPRAGLNKMIQGLAALRATGGAAVLPYSLALLADAYMEDGQAEGARAAVAEALTIVDERGVRQAEAELYRLKGELTLQAGDEEEAEACRLKAIGIAQRQQAKSWELRAAMSLARLWQQQDKTTEARGLLAPVYNWFTEGFDTQDLKDAKALLQDLS